MQTKMIEKTDGHGNLYMVPDPDFTDMAGRTKKFRNKPTNVFPKKKKRK